LEAVATTFALGFGRGVLPLRDEHVAVGDAEQAFWLSCRATPCTLLHNSFDGLDGLELAPKRIASLTRQYIAPTFAPLARETVHETTEILVTSIAGLDRDPPPRNVGGVRDWRLPDRGLFRDERSAAGASRWTDGDAELALPQVRANAIELRIAVAPPEPREVRIELDGKSIFEKRIDPGEHVLRFDLASPEPMLRRLALRSSTFVPQKLGLSSDRRTLGILVRAIRLIDEALPPLTAEAPKEAYRSAIIVLGPDAQSPVRLKRNQSAWPLTVRVDHLGAMAWPVRGHVADGEPHVALGVFWTRAGQRERVAEQRVPLPYALRPGERWWTVVPLDLSSTPLNDLPAGDYEVSIGLVHEGVAWFADHGDALARINVKIVP
jgi:hypothetical protein